MGLVGGMARTAVVAGTATAVSNRVSRRQAGRWAAQEQQQYVKVRLPIEEGLASVAFKPPLTTTDIYDLNNDEKAKNDHESKNDDEPKNDYEP